jgi:hypothetical protein
MLKSDKLEFERGAAAKTENQDRYKGKENRHHDCDGTAGSQKSPASLSPVEILSKDKLFTARLCRRSVLFPAGSLLQLHYRLRRMLRRGFCHCLPLRHPAFFDAGREDKDITYAADRSPYLTISLDTFISKALVQNMLRAVGCPCRKLKLEHIGGVARPGLAMEARRLLSGRRAGELSPNLGDRRGQAAAA